MSLQSNIKSRYYFWNIYRVFRKNCVCSQFTATPPSPASLCCKRFSKLSNAMRVYSHSYWLVIFCTTNSSRVLARERWQTFENSWKKTQYILNTLYVINVYAETYSPYSLCRRILVGGEGQPVTTIYVWFFCGLSSFNGTLFRKHKSG